MVAKRTSKSAAKTAGTRAKKPAPVAKKKPAAKKPAAKKAPSKKPAAKKAPASKATAKKSATKKKPAAKRPAAAAEQSYDELYERVGRARAAAWEGLGTTEGWNMTFLINPTFMGAPRWPAMRQAFRVAKHDGATIVASDGLSDPGDREPFARTGVGFEVYAETRDELAGHIVETWLYQLVYQVAQLAALNASRGTGFAALFDELGTISTELYDVSSAPGAFVNAEGRVGVVLNVVDEAVFPSHIELPTGRVRLVNVKLLRLAELAHIVEHGVKGRAEIAKRLAAQGDALVSSTARPSVV